jgi:dihydrofolate reductase
MSKLIYITNVSLDGYIEDRTGAFDWGNPDEVFDFITELMRPIGTHLLGRRLYEIMAHWDGPLEGYPPEQRDFARVWQKAEQIVFSRTLTRAPARIGRVSSGSSIPRQLGHSSANRRTTSSLAAPNWQHWRSNPISSTNVTCFSIR